jgi:hypothetical protein
LAQNPKHLYDLSPKLAHSVETISLGSKGFQTGVMLGGAWGARQFFCRRNLAERRTHTTGQVARVLLARILNWLNQVAKAFSLISQYLSKMFSRFVQY